MNEQGGVEKGFFTLNLLEKGIFSGLRLDPSGPPLPGEVFTPLDFSPVLAFHAPWDFDGSAPAEVAAKWQNSQGPVNDDPLAILTNWGSLNAHATQDVENKRARITDAINGLFGIAPSYKFDGADDAYMVASVPLGADGLTVFYAGRSANKLGFIYEHGSNAGTTPGSWMLAVETTRVEFAIRFKRATVGDNVAGNDDWRAAWVEGDEHYAVQRFTPGDADPHTFFVDGVDARTARSTSGAPSGELVANFYIGSRLAGTIAPYQGLMTSLWVFNGALTDEQVQQVQTWLIENTGF